MEGEDMEKGKMPSESSDVSPEKAKEILKHGSVHGHELTKDQEGFFGAIAGQSEDKKSE